MSPNTASAAQSMRLPQRLVPGPTSTSWGSTDGSRQHVGVQTYPSDFIWRADARDRAKANQYNHVWRFYAESGFPPELPLRGTQHLNLDLGTLGDLGVAGRDHQQTTGLGERTEVTFPDRTRRRAVP